MTFAAAKFELPLCDQRANSGMKRNVAIIDSIITNNTEHCQSYVTAVSVTLVQKLFIVLTLQILYLLVSMLSASLCVIQSPRGFLEVIVFN